MCRTAAQIFRDRGFDATSVSDIARALGLTKAGLYHYFDSKEALLFEIMIVRSRPRPRRGDRAGARDPRSRGTAATADHATRAHRDPRARRRRPPAATRSARCRRRRANRSSSRMRVYFDLVRDTLDELHARRPPARRRSDRRHLQPDRDDSVAASMVPAGWTAHAGSGRRRKSPSSRSAGCCRRAAAGTREAGRAAGRVKARP